MVAGLAPPSAPPPASVRASTDAGSITIAVPGSVTYKVNAHALVGLFDPAEALMTGTVQNQDSYAQGVAAQRPFYFDHLAELTDRALAEFEALTGRGYARAMGYRLEDAELVLAGQGSVVANAEAVADYLREARGLKVGVLNLTMFRPFPADFVTQLLAGKQAVAEAAARAWAAKGRTQRPERHLSLPKRRSRQPVCGGPRRDWSRHAQATRARRARPGGGAPGRPAAG